MIRQHFYRINLLQRFVHFKIVILFSKWYQ